MCCGGSARPQRVRQQAVAAPVPAATRTALQRKVGTAQVLTPQRQYIVQREQCIKCGYPGMLVHIAGRERIQCSNANCRQIFK